MDRNRPRTDYKPWLLGLAVLLVLGFFALRDPRCPPIPLPILLPPSLPIEPRVPEQSLGQDQGGDGAAGGVGTAPGADQATAPQTPASAQAPAEPLAPHIPLNESHTEFLVKSQDPDYCYIHRSGVLPEGWLTWEECCILYHLARKTNGPIYEQGSFRGRSTCCIAQGVKDSKVKKTFITSDIFPIGAKSFATGKFPYNSIPYRWQYRPGKQKKPLVDFMVDGTRAGSSTVEEYSKMLDKIYEQPGGLLAELVGGVARAGLSDYVYIIAGKTVPDLDYQLVWTDSAHGLREIAANMNNWQRFLREDRPTVFAFHDVALDNESMRYVRTQMNVTYEFSMKTIFVIEAWKNKNWVPIDLKKLRQGGRWTRPKRPLRKSDNRQ